MWITINAKNLGNKTSRIKSSGLKLTENFQLKNGVIVPINK